MHLFDIITQYRAIFSDDDPGLLADDDESSSYSGLFHAWIVRKVMSLFIIMVEIQLRSNMNESLCITYNPAFKPWAYIQLC